MPTIQTRRRFLTILSMAYAASTLSSQRRLAAKSALAARARAAEGALETTTVRIDKDRSTCAAPQDVAEELLRAEGFTDIRYVEMEPYRLSAQQNPLVVAMERGEVDFGMNFPVLFIPAVETGAPVTVLAGVHSGCFELFAREGIRSITELKGKTVGLNASPPGLLILMAAQVGLDPTNDISWVTGADPSVQPLELFAEGKIDAFLGFPPEPQELRARRTGRVIVSTTLDRPWSQYFCCMLTAHREFVGKYPVATKRVLRAILKATDICATDPMRVARRLVDGGFTERYDYALQTLNEVPYNNWREYEPEDTMRFYALRLRDAGLIKASPQKIIAHGTDWRFLEELKRELKA